MALYQPTQIVPSSLSGYGDGVIDITEPLIVSWQVNGFSALVAYQIVIYQNDTDSTQMLDTGKITLSEPFYGTNENGDQELFHADEITAADMSTAGMTNGYANGYKIIITQWWGSTDDESITQTSASVFITRDIPSIVMDAISSPLASKELSVGATYTQAQGDTLSWVRWTLKDSSGNMLKDTGRVSTGVLRFDYDGLFSGSSYDIECSIETENGVTATTGPITFNVSYSMSPSEGLVDVCRRAGQPYVEVSWSDRSAISGTGSGEYSIAGGLLRLPAGSSVTWNESGGDPITFVAPWSMAWRAQIPTLVGKNLFDVSSITWNSGIRGDDGTPTASGSSHYTSEISVLPDTQYTISGSITGPSKTWRVYYLQTDGTWIERTGSYSSEPKTITTPANCGKIQIQCNTSFDLSDVQIEYGDQATPFEPYGTANPVTLTCENSDTIEVIVKNTSVSIEQNGTPLMTQALTMKKNDTLVLAMTPTKWYLKQVTYTGGLLPAPDLYPSSTLYPAPVYQQINTWEGTLTYTQENITGFTLNGAQTCEYLWLYRGELPQSIVYNLMGGEWFEPSFDSMTLFLATFANNDLNADVSGGAGDVVYGMTIYRRESDNEVLLHIADVEPGFTLFRDFGCKANTLYTYFLYVRGQDTYVSAPFKSDAIQPRFNFYTLMECERDQTDKHQYHVLQAFLVSGNLNAGSISNGNNPNILTNFTRYPIRQGVPQNYKSGVLTSLIGAVDYTVNSYSDTWELADRIQELSLSQNALFLKDMKGAMWMIHTNGPISMSVDNKSYAQPIQMSFPWVEVGSAEGLSIVSLPTDSTWPKDEIINTSVYVDTNTGELLWTIPNVYEGSTLSISDNGKLIAQGSGNIEMAEIAIDSNENLIVTQ